MIPIRRSGPWYMGTWLPLLALLLTLGDRAPCAAQLQLEEINSAPLVALRGKPWSFQADFSWEPNRAYANDTQIYWRLYRNGHVVDNATLEALDQFGALITTQYFNVSDRRLGNHQYELELSLREDFLAATKQGFHTHVIPGGLTLLPPLITVIMVLLTRNVLLSLYVGVFSACFIIYRFNPLRAFARSFDTLIVGAFADEGHVQVILFTWFLSGMIACVLKSGGGEGLVAALSKYATTARAGALVTIGLGLCIFFDGIANTLIVGQTVRPITDALSLSREKLAFLVDGTSAPVTSLSPISTWVGFELSLIETTLQSLAEKGQDVTCYDDSAFIIFVNTIPGRFYPFLMICLQLFLVITDREFGPMLTAERRARTEGADHAEHEGDSDALEDYARMDPDPRLPKRWWNAAIPVGLTTLITLIGLLVTGVENARKLDMPLTGANIFGQSESYRALLYGSFLGSVAIWFLAWAQRVRPLDESEPLKRTPGESLASSHGGTPHEDMALREGADTLSPASRGADGPASPRAWQAGEAPAEVVSAEADIARAIARPVLWFAKAPAKPFLTWTESLNVWVFGIQNLTFAILILLLAWGVGTAFTLCGTGEFISTSLVGNVDAGSYPALTFIVASILALVTGSSWGAMAILFPLILPAAHQAAPCNKTVFYGTISSILSGAVFGDHCSPISDTSILSAIACRCNLGAHIKTQAPYALLCGLVGILFGELPTGYGAYPAAVGLVLCIAITLLATYFLSVPTSSQRIDWVTRSYRYVVAHLLPARKRPYVIDAESNGDSSTLALTRRRPADLEHAPLVVSEDSAV